jgi:hypothetical protein
MPGAVIIAALDPRCEIRQQLGRRLFLAAGGEVVVYLPIAEQEYFAGSAVGLPSAPLRCLAMMLSGRWPAIARTRSAKLSATRLAAGPCRRKSSKPASTCTAK